MGATVGILGDGQLALFLAKAALRQGLKPTALIAQKSSPVSFSGAEVQIGDPNQESSLSGFFQNLEICTFENEFLDCDRVESAQHSTRCKIIPSLSSLRLLQDKLSQKKILIKLGIPTPPFHEMTFEGKNLVEVVHETLQRFQGRCVFKKSRLGYDGKGVLVYESHRLDELLSFCSEAASQGIPVYAESRVDFKNELALVAVQGQTSEFYAYPLVFSEQQQAVCFRVFGPAGCFDASTQKLQPQAVQIARAIAQETGIQGAFAIEFFQDQEGTLLVNEIAPRVHNSGHYSLDACPGASQFDLHWQAILGLRLHPPLQTPFFGMLNLLGPSQAGAFPVQEPQPPSPSFFLHWYHKNESRPRRKLGHVNFVAETRLEFDQKLSELMSWHQNWVESLLKSHFKGAPSSEG